jgi:flagellar basal-body rod protein FlgC
MPNLMNSLHIASAGMEVQSTRLKVTAQNIANADSIAETPGGDPYRRKIVTFRNVFDREMGIDKVQVKKVGLDDSDFKLKYEPGHPSADADGYVAYPNIEPMVEMMDVREAQRSYEANLHVIEMSKRMLQQTVDLLR